MAREGVYVYGFVGAADAPDLGCIGLEHAGAPARVYAIHEGRVAAVVSDHDARGRVMPIRRNLDRHDRVIRETLQRTTILPATFGHVARDARQVAATLRRHAASIVRELDRLHAKVEMAVRVTWDVDNIFKYLVDAHPVLAELRDRIFVAGRPARQDDKIELGRLYEERLDAERTGVADRLVSALLPGAADARVSRVTAEKMAADVAFLVPRDGADAFRERVRDAAAEWPGEYAFQCSGPWAPFNFVQLEIEGGDADRRGAACAS